MEIPQYAADMQASLARIEQQLTDHIKYHNGSGKTKLWVALGAGIGIGIAGLGDSLVKLLGT